MLPDPIEQTLGNVIFKLLVNISEIAAQFQVEYVVISSL